MRKYKEVKRKEIIFDVEEWSKVERLAKQANMTTSELIRRMTLNGKVVKVDMENVMPLVNAIRSVSNNINQIARMANETHSIYADEVGRLREETLRLCRILNQYVSTLPSSAA